MARPIKETPVLKGKDALVFLEKMKKDEATKVDDKTRKRMMENYQKLHSIAQF